MSKPIRERATNYGSVGATAHFDFHRFPPKGFEVVQMRSRIGHGRPRYDAAVAALRTWKIQRLAALEGHPEAGEERFTVEIAEDQTVFLHFRAIVRNAKWWVKLGAPIAKSVRAKYHDRYLDVLRSIDVR